MTDNYQYHSSGLEAPGRRHWQIAPSNGADLDPIPRAIYCAVSGTVAIRDVAGTDLTYTLSAGDVLPFRGVRVLASGTTATVYGWE